MLARCGLAALILATIAPSEAASPQTREAASNPVHCVAVLELMSRAEPRWMTQVDAKLARLSWQIAAGTSARKTNADVGAQVNHALTALTEDTEPQRRELTVLASQCVADAPL